MDCLGKLRLAVLLLGALSPRLEAAEEPPIEAGSTVSASPDGFVLQSGDGAFRLRIGGYAHADGRFFVDDDDGLGANAFILRRARLTLTGTVARIFDFNVGMDFGSGASSVLQDAYLDARRSARARIRVGKFKVPFSLERQHAASGLLFVERAFPSSLGPNRDVGVQFLGEVGGGKAAYALAVTNGVQDGGSSDTDNDDGKDVAGRVFFQPFKASGRRRAAGIGFGFAATTGQREGAVPGLRSPGQLTYFGYVSGINARGTHTRYAPQASYAVGPLRLYGEFVRSSQRVRKDADALPVTHDAWLAAAGFVLTGETPGFYGVAPKRPFGRGAGWGAFELAVRYSELDVDDSVFTTGLADPTRSATSTRAFAFGMNWYLSRNLRYTANYERSVFDGGSAGGDRPVENVVLFRAQVAF